MFIKADEIRCLIEEAKSVTKEEIQGVLQKARKWEKLTHKDIAILLEIEDEAQIKEMYEIAGTIKEAIYGKRIVMFAPLYISDYCVNNCVYCGYQRCNSFKRRKLTQEEIAQEVEILEKMGHKRLALELGEDPLNTPIEYVLESIHTIYKTQKENGNIRRVNVNIAATTIGEYKQLKEADIGTYILFQETYEEETYEKVHPKCRKGNFKYHLTAFDRAMEAGIDDVGAGVLFGLADPKFEVLGLMMHNEHLEEKFGVGFHTISVPRIKKAKGVDLEHLPYPVDDEMFKKIVAIIRIAVPFTGIIMSTRETSEMRRELLHYGVSQMSAGSSTGVGGYMERENGENTSQFVTSDERSPIAVLEELIDDGYIPSYCTACYRKGRTGEHFMSLAKKGDIQYVCQPNAMTTIMEYALDYGDSTFQEKVENLINKEVENIKSEQIKAVFLSNLEKLKKGERDLYL